MSKYRKQLPRGLPYFRNDPVLFIVAGSEGARLILVRNGFAEQVAVVKVTDPDSGRGLPTPGEEGIWGAASMSEVTEGEAKNGIAKHIADEAATIFKKVRLRGVYIFAPSNRVTGIRQALPAALRDGIRMIVRRNLIEKEAEDLVGMIAKKKVGRETPTRLQRNERRKPLRSIRK